MKRPIEISGKIKSLREITNAQAENSTCFAFENVLIKHLTMKERGKVIFKLGNYLQQKMSVIGKRNLEIQNEIVRKIDDLETKDFSKEEVLQFLKELHGKLK